ncbi:hypothetical protein HY025_01340 [Candidatus Daviesbacteria bacterium]|nr:hypothetical protein [Candidatus Daviesbacteria bacterium]
MEFEIGPGTGPNKNETGLKIGFELTCFNQACAKVITAGSDRIIIPKLLASANWNLDFLSVFQMKQVHILFNPGHEQNLSLVKYNLAAIKELANCPEY